MSEEDTTELSVSLMANINAILEVGKQKIEMTDDEMEAMKVLVIKGFLKEAEKKDTPHSSNP